jgi:hypothetical protein
MGGGLQREQTDVEAILATDSSRAVVIIIPTTATRS